MDVLNGEVVAPADVRARCEEAGGFLEYAERQRPRTRVADAVREIAARALLCIGGVCVVEAISPLFGRSLLPNVRIVAGGIATVVALSIAIPRILQHTVRIEQFLPATWVATQDTKDKLNDPDAWSDLHRRVEILNRRRPDLPPSVRLGVAWYMSARNNGDEVTVESILGEPVAPPSHTCCHCAADVEGEITTLPSGRHIANSHLKEVIDAILTGKDFDRNAWECTHPHHHDAEYQGSQELPMELFNLAGERIRAAADRYREPHVARWGKYAVVFATAGAVIFGLVAGHIFGTAGLAVRVAAVAGVFLGLARATASSEAMDDNQFRQAITASFAVNAYQPSDEALEVLTGRGIPQDYSLANQGWQQKAATDYPQLTEAGRQAFAHYSILYSP